MGFLRYTHVIMPSIQASAGAFALAGQSADLKQNAAPPIGHNNKKLQTNLSDMQTAADYAFINVLKTAQTWSYYGAPNTPITPDVLDNDGYLISMAGPASGGIYTTCFIPSPQLRPGAWICKWDGNGTVGQRSNATAVFYSISSITQSGGIQTFTLASSPVEMAAGQPIALSNITGGTWGSLWNNWTVLDVNKAGNSFRINTGTTFTGTLDPLTNARATFTTNTTVANGTGFNGSGRYAVNLNPLIGGGDPVGAGCDITNIRSSSDYPHNIRLFHINDEVALDAGEVFTSLFLSTAGYFGVIRFLDWQYTTSNQCNVTTWWSRKPVSYVSYEADEKRPSLYASGGTTLSGRTYSCAAPAINSSTGAAWSGLLDKSTVHVLFTSGAFTVTNTVSGNNIAIPGHTYINGDQVQFYQYTPGATAPITMGQSFFVRNIVAGTSIQLSATLTGSIITPGGNFTGTITCGRVWTSFDVTNTVSGATIAIPNHTYVNGDQVVFYNNGGAGFPANVPQNTHFFVRNVVAGTSIQISATSAGAIITPASNFSGLVISSGAIFLNVGGTGAKKFLTMYGNPIGNPSQSFQWPSAGTYTSLCTVVYDAIMDAYIMHGGSMAVGSYGLLNFCPYEIQLALCAQIKAHPYWVTPIWAIDPMTDFMPSLMKYAKDNAPAWMIPRYEPPNETWNTSFPQTSIASLKATIYGWTGQWFSWYGKALSTLGQAAASVYGGVGNLGTTYQVLGGVQTGIGVTGDMANSFEKFSSAQYIGTTPQSPLTGSWGTITFSATLGVAEAWRWTSHIVVANYTTPNVYMAADGAQSHAALATAFKGSRFTATIASGVMTVASLDQGANLTVGATISGFNVPSGVTITSFGTGTGTTGTYNLSNSSFSLAYSQSYTSGVDLTAPTKMADSLIDTVVNATITGANFVVNSIVSGNTFYTNSAASVSGGTIAFCSGVYITGGTYPNFTLNTSPGNQTATFKIGVTFSATGTPQLWLLWATWAKTNFGINKITGYEGGYSVDYGPHGVAADLLSARSKQTPSMQGYTSTVYDNVRGVGTITYPSGVSGEFPSAFAMTAPYPVGSGWSVLDDIYQPSTSPQWAAIIAY
jgi:hypothetical protein